MFFLSNNLFLQLICTCISCKYVQFIFCVSVLNKVSIILQEKQAATLWEALSLKQRQCRIGSFLKQGPTPTLSIHCRSRHRWCNALFWVGCPGMGFSSKLYWIAKGILGNVSGTSWLAIEPEAMRYISDPWTSPKYICISFLGENLFVFVFWALED